MTLYLTFYARHAQLIARFAWRDKIVLLNDAGSGDRHCLDGNFLKLSIRMFTQKMSLQADSMV
ncbi:hypothetical protein [Thiosocius teredinicola]|uniref:hypothetical protein n=1 Tax=Thiosocius teredinicola TaxID=1973002 RepID=UPI0009912926